MIRPTNYQDLKAQYQAANVLERVAIVEALIDATSAASVLNMMSIACSEKADHVRETYGQGRENRHLARQWRLASNRIETAVTTLDTMRVPGISHDVQVDSTREVSA